MDFSTPYPSHLPHVRPPWVRSDALYFITLCALPRGANTLCRSPLAENLWASVVHYAELGKWWPTLVLLMPDHLHALMSFADGLNIAKTMGAWKGYAARMYGIRWQADFFEHRLRYDESWREKSEYIVQNPVRGKLVTKADEWPYVWRMGLPS